MANTYLSSAISGKLYRVTVIPGGHGIQKRLQDLGIVPGSELEIIQNDERRPILIKTHDTVLMIGRGIAKKILAEELFYTVKPSYESSAAEHDGRNGICH